MIWSSFKTVVYPFSLSASCTSRTVEGPRPHKTRRISSSDAVGFCGERVMRAQYYEDIRSVNENLRRKMRSGSARASRWRDRRGGCRDVRNGGLVPSFRVLLFALAGGFGFLP